MQTSTIYSATTPSFGVYFRTLLSYKGILKVLIWKDIKLRYRHRWFVVFSTLLQPVVTTFSVCCIFSNISFSTKTSIEHIIAVHIGILIWSYISRCLTVSGTSLRQNSGLLTRVYFPHILLPVSLAIAGLFDLAIGFVSLYVAIFFYAPQTMPMDLLLMGIPAFTLLMIIAGLGLGLWLCVFDFCYEDISYMLPFCVQIGFFMTPILYISAEGYSRNFFNYLNPIATVIGGFRWMLLGAVPPAPLAILISSCIAIASFVSGSVLICKWQIRLGDQIES